VFFIPKGRLSRRVEYEEHTTIFGERIPEHQTHRPRLFVLGQLGLQRYSPDPPNSTVRNPNGSTVFVELHPAKNIPRRIQSKGLNQRGTVNFRFNVHSDFKSLRQRRTKHAVVTHLAADSSFQLTVQMQFGSGLGPKSATNQEVYHRSRDRPVGSP